MFGKLKITDKTNYHIYILNKIETDNISKNKSNRICFFQKNNSVKSGDIIIIYQKEKLNCGFNSVVQLCSDVKYNDKNIKISSDNNMNRYYAKINFKKNFIEIISPEEIIKYLSTDSVGFKNASVFKKKYTSKLNALIGFDVYGKKIMTRLFVQDEDNFIKSEEKKQELEEDEDEDEKLDEDLEEEDEELEEDEVLENKSEDTNESSISDNPGFIPIMVVPCKEFKLPKKDREEYFVDHYMACKKCDITNNNKNSELTRIINKNNVEIFELTVSKHYYYNPAINAYHDLSNYEPQEIKKKNKARIIYINNGDEDYDGCFLITLAN